MLNIKDLKSKPFKNDLRDL